MIRKSRAQGTNERRARDKNSAVRAMSADLGPIALSETLRQVSAFYELPSLLMHRQQHTIGY